MTQRIWSFLSAFILLLCGGVYAPHKAHAQISELRFGFQEFDQRSLDITLAARDGNENSLALNAEILFAEPDFLKWALTPQPYIGGALNIGGETSFGGGGLLWRQGFGKRFYGDLSVGLVAHTGLLDIQNQNITSLAQLLTLNAENIEFGTRILFREQLALGYRLTPKWSTEIFVEHLSNANIARDNEGADSLGLRLARRF